MEDIQPMKRQVIIIILALTACPFGQQPAKKPSAPAQPSPNTVKLAPPEVRQRMLRLVAARKPVTVTIPIAVTPAKLKHQDVMLKLQKQKQTVDTLRITMTSARNGTQPATPPPAGKGGGGGMQGGKSKESMAQRSEITPSSNVGVVQQRGSPTHISPVINPNLSAAVCHGPTISTVNERSIGAAIFTTDPDHNANMVAGCGFGNQPGSVYLTGPFTTPQVPMVIDEWTDTWINMEMKSSFSGELDHYGNVTLVIVAANGQQTQAAGFTFYAARAQQQLSMFPRSQANLQIIPDAVGQNTVNINFTSPASSVPVAVDIFRSDAGRFGLGFDSFSFNQLSPGFYPDQAMFWHFDMTQADCDADFYVDGFWAARWDDKANALTVYTQEQHCHVAPTVNTTSYDYSWSHYALAVRVIGPRGVNPWAVQQ
jgi:hypothetical protein